MEHTNKFIQNSAKDTMSSGNNTYVACIVNNIIEKKSNLDVVIVCDRFRFSKGILEGIKKWPF